MPSPNGAALQTSDVNPFLFADVGIEPNGSKLTVLSLLARLDVDPWSEARRLAKLPQYDALDCLCERIARTPLSPDNHEDRRGRAARLVNLLPVQAGVLARGSVEPRDGVPVRIAAIIGETPAMLDGVRSYLGFPGDRSCNQRDAYTKASRGESPAHPPAFAMTTPVTASSQNMEGNLC